MTEYTRTRTGPPEGGHYSVGDTVVDGQKTKWACVRGGMADGAGSDPQHAMFVAIPSGVENNKQAAPVAKTGAVTLTAAELLVGLITGNPAGAVAYTLPLASALDTARPSMQVDESFEFSLINIAVTAANDITVTTNTGWTLVGEMVVDADEATQVLPSAARFRARKTAASAYTLYRVA